MDTHYNFRNSFLKLSQTIAVRAALSKDHPDLVQWWKYRWVHLDQFFGHGIDYEEKMYEDTSRAYAIHELAYQLRSTYAPRPFIAMLNAQAGKGFVRLNADYQQHFVGKSNWKGLWVHAFAGWLPYFDHPDANVTFSFNGITSYGYHATDYMYDQWLPGRNENDGLTSRQIFQKDAQLKTLATIGISEEWMAGGGFSVAMPFRFIHAYMDAAIYPSGITEKTAFSYSGGLAVVVLKDAFEIYVPLLESKDIRNSLSYEVRNIWHKRISFLLNFKKANPIELVDRLQLGY